MKGDSIQEYHLLRKGGVWMLLNVVEHRERSFGSSTKQEALRRVAAFLRGRRGLAKLLIHTMRGAPVSERFYEGAEPTAYGTTLPHG